MSGRFCTGLTLNLGARYDLQFLQSIQTDKNNVSPRVGLAWSPYGDGRMVVRGSYGLFFDRVPLRALANALLSAGNTTDASQARLLSYTFSPGQAGAPVFPGVASAPPAVAAVNFTLMDRQIPNAYAQQLGLEVQQAIASNLTLSVSYQHVRGLHLVTSVNHNINADGTRPNPALGNVKAYQGSADSYYDGLAVSVVQRPAPWGSVRLSYTWAKSIDDVGQAFFSAPVNNFFSGEDRSRSDNDQRHRLSVDSSLTSPSAPPTGFVQRLTHAWRTSAILQYSSRLPFNVVTGTTSSQGTTLRPCTQTSFGSAACTQALPGTLISRNAGVGFDLFNLNVRLTRSFRVNERVHLEALAESFNALNHRNDQIPNGTWGTGRYPSQPNAIFGQATAAADARSAEVALRLSF